MIDLYGYVLAVGSNNQLAFIPNSSLKDMSSGETMLLIPLRKAPYSTMQLRAKGYQPFL